MPWACLLLVACLLPSDLICAIAAGTPVPCGDGFFVPCFMRVGLFQRSKAGHGIFVTGFAVSMHRLGHGDPLKELHPCHANCPVDLSVNH